MRKAISTHFTPPANRATNKRPEPKAAYQGLGALPSYQTEDVLYRTVARSGQMGLEQWTWDAGTYTWCNKSSVCNGTSLVEGKCCDRQGDWFPQQGDYLPKSSRFPEHGFPAIQRAITSQVGPMGVWITPQASNLSQIYPRHSTLYLNSTKSDNNLLNLSDHAAQDLFYGQFKTLIDEFNCSRIWFDYNTQARSTHWNLHEAEDGQGLLELGFYRGLYAVWERTLAAYPHVWIEGCASGGRLIDLGSLSRTHSHWINDDSVDDDRNRRLRLGANHFLPAHYLQNAFLPVGTGALPPHVLEPVVGPISVDPQRLLTYFNGVLQFGQGVAFWSNASIAAAAGMVRSYKDIRRFLDPLCCDYYRLFERPPYPVSSSSYAGAPSATNYTKYAVGYVFEDAAQREGIIYLMAQREASTTSVQVAVDRRNWPWSAPAPAFIREGGTPPTFSLVAGAAGTAVHVLESSGFLEIAFPSVDCQALLRFRY